jgi:hypothetical protein
MPGKALEAEQQPGLFGERRLRIVVQDESAHAWLFRQWDGMGETERSFL